MMNTIGIEGNLNFSSEKQCHLNVYVIIPS